MGNTGSFGFGPFSMSGPDPVNNAGDMINAQIQHGWSEDAAHDQQAYETAMSNTAYQRAVGDMTKAGINPMLAVGNGGASTPSVSQQVVPNLMGGAGQAHSAGGFDPNYLKTGKVLDGQSQKLLADTANAIAELPGIHSASASKAVQTSMDRLTLENQKMMQDARAEMGDPLYKARAATEALGTGNVGASAGLGAFLGSSAADAASGSGAPYIDPGGMAPQSGGFSGSW